MEINCSGSPPKSKAKACDGCSSDDEVSTQAARSECSTQSEPSDDEEEVPTPSRSEYLDSNFGQIPIATLLALRPRRGNPPAGYLHAVLDEKKQNLISAQSPPKTDRWECFRADGRDSRDDSRSGVDRAAPWRRTTPDLASVGPPSAEASVRANKPGSLSSSLSGSTALRPTRKL
jgi:hypothetical protein